MSEFIKRDIADAVIAILDGLDKLSEIKLFIRGGVPVPVPIDKHPFIEVEIGEEQPVGKYTGELEEQNYIGLITVNTLAKRGDWLHPISSRVACIPSYDQVEEFTQAILFELQKDDHKSLGDLRCTSEDGTVEVVTNLEMIGPRIYGLDDRTENYTNFGSLPFQVTTERSLS
jgi:hypothetical protein